MKQVQKAAFYISDYYFDKVLLDLNNRPENDELSVSFSTSGKFIYQEKSFELKFLVEINGDEEKKEGAFISVNCIGKFKFENVNNISEIPDFFYMNSVALLFPYVRAYISIITTQSNTRGVILPTLNLSSLGEELRKNTIEVK